MGVSDKPIRGSRSSARWCRATIEQLWNARQNQISPNERPAAQEAFQHAGDIYRQLEEEAPEGT